MTAFLIALVALLADRRGRCWSCARPTARGPRHAPVRARTGATSGSCSRSSGTALVAACARRRAAARARRGRDARAGVPGARVAAPAARHAAAAPVEDRDAAAGGDRAARGKLGVPVDARIERGRTYRHALRQTIEHEQFDRIVIAAPRTAPTGSTPTTSPGCSTTPGEIVVLRPSSDDRFEVLPARPQRRARPRRRSAAGTPPAAGGEHKSSPLRLIGARRAARA